MPITDRRLTDIGVRHDLTVPEPASRKVSASELQNLGVDVESIQNDVDTSIQEQQDKTISIQDFNVKVNNAIDSGDFSNLSDEDIFNEMLISAQQNGISIEGIDIEDAIQEITPKTNEKQAADFLGLDKGIGLPSFVENDPILSGAAKFGEKIIDPQGISRETLSVSPEITANILGFTADVLTPKEKEGLGDELRAAGITSKALFQDALGVDPDAMRTKAVELGVKTGVSLIGPGKIKILNKLPILKSFLESKKFIPALVKGTGVGLGTSTKFSAVNKGEVTGTDLLIGGGIGGGLPVLTYGVPYVFKGTSNLLKNLASKLGSVDKKVIPLIQENPQLAKKVINGDVKIEELTKELNKIFPNKELANAELRKLKDTTKTYYQSLVSKGQKTEDDLIQKFVDNIDEVNKAKNLSGKAFEKFKTDKVVTSDSKINSLLDEFKKQSGTTGVKQSKALNNIENEIKAFKVKNITAQQLDEIEKNVRGLVDFSKVGDKANDIYKRFSKILNTHKKDVIPGLEEESKKFSELVKIADELDPILNTTKGDIRSNIRNTVRTLQKTVKKEKFDQFLKLFGGDKKKFITQLDEIENGIEVEKAINSLKGNAQSLLKGLGQGDLSPAKQKIVNSIKTDLQKVAEKEGLADISESVFTKIGGVNQLNIDKVTDSVIKNINIKNPELAFKFNLLKALDVDLLQQGSAKTFVTAGGLIKNPGAGLAMNILLTDSSLWTKGLLKYELALNKTSKLSTSIIEKLRVGDKLQTNEKDLIQNFLQKLMVVSGVNE